MGCYTFAQLEEFARQAGFPEPLVPIMAAIAKAESGGCDVIQQGTSYCGQGADKTGWGLWQITCGNSVPQVGTDFQLLNPLTNAKAAYAKFASGQGLGAWATYTSGAYTAFLPGSSSYEPGARQYAGPGTAPAGSTQNAPAPSPSGSGSTPVLGGLGNALGQAGNTAGSAAGSVGNAAGSLFSAVTQAPSKALGSIGSGISSGLLNVGTHALPWIIILGVLFLAIIMFSRELSGGSRAAPAPSPTPTRARAATAGEGASEAAAAAA